jgi:plastocyanin
VTRHARTVPALALLLGAALTAIPAAAQYDDPPGGGDPDPPENCAGAPNKVEVTGSSLSFSPSTITIDAGQAVCWTWNASMPHNVRANDGSFGSGQPAGQGSFQRTFAEAGTYGYHCQVHGSATAGMRGTVVVRGNDGGGGGGGDGEESGPGTLSLDPGSYSVDEDAGSVSLTIVRTGGTDGKVTVKVATGTGSARKGKDFVPRKQTLTFLNGERGPKTITIPIKNDRAIEPDETFGVALSKATGRATIGNSSASVTIHDDDGADDSAAALLAPSGVEAAGISGREIRLAWAADSLAVEAVRIERRSGDGAFREIAVVPAGTGEHVDAELASGASFHYRLRAEGAGELSEYSDIVAAATDGAIGPCAASGQVLCLGGGRFEAKAAFRGADDEPLRSAVRSEAPAALRTGLLAFGNADDPELMLKVVEGCATNDHFWVELAAVTDFELEVAVRDTQTGRTWVFFNPAGRAAGVVRDLDAFGTCP